MAIFPALQFLYHFITFSSSHYDYLTNHKLLPNEESWHYNI